MTLKVMSTTRPTPSSDSESRTFHSGMLSRSNGVEEVVITNKHEDYIPDLLAVGATGGES